MNKHAIKIGLLGSIVLQGSIIPTLIMVLMGVPNSAPPLILIGLLWFGLLLCLIYSLVIKNKVFIANNAAGLVLQTIMISILLTN